MEFRASATEDVLPIFGFVPDIAPPREIYFPPGSGARDGVGPPPLMTRPGSAIETGAISTNKAARQMATLYLIIMVSPMFTFIQLSFQGNAQRARPYNSRASVTPFLLSSTRNSAIASRSRASCLELRGGSEGRTTSHRVLEDLCQLGWNVYVAAYGHSPRTR